MLKFEKNYDFRKRLCTPHSKKLPDGRSFENCYTLPEKVKLAMKENGEVATVAAEDFIDYLDVSFGIKATLAADGDADVKIFIDPIGLGENANGYMGRRVTVDASGITVQAYDERGIAQALYSLEGKKP